MMQPARSIRVLLAEGSMVIRDRVIQLLDGDGRFQVLATAADALLAGQLASRLGFIDQLYASDGERNLKGATKAEMLTCKFPAGFIYAGDSKADLAVWARAAGVILVNPRKLVRDAALALGRPTLELLGRA